MNWAWTVKLVAGPTRVLKAKLAEHFFHRDLPAKFVEIDTWHRQRLLESAFITRFREEAPVLVWTGGAHSRRMLVFAFIW